MSKKKLTRIQVLKAMLENWRESSMVQATRYYKYVENKYTKDAYERGYKAALTDVIIKIEDDNY